VSISSKRFDSGWFRGSPFASEGRQICLSPSVSSGMAKAMASSASSSEKRPKG
jgi:hypothetical protein